MYIYLRLSILSTKLLRDLLMILGCKQRKLFWNLSINGDNKFFEFLSGAVTQIFTVNPIEK
jgi:hypothetical protein